MDLIAIAATCDPEAESNPQAIRAIRQLARWLQCSPAMARDHRKLDAFSLADEFVVAIYQHTTRLPIGEQYGLQSQLRRAALSAAANIVEGCGRDSLNDYLRFLDIAFASVREVLYLLTIAKRLSLIDDASATSLIKLGDRVAGSLLNLRRSLRR
jgi:four helix bundle protein